ncbi:hypothetical protein LEMLEM_LOCUS3955, partial [Lemmus lemmus]
MKTGSFFVLLSQEQNEESGMSMLLPVLSPSAFPSDCCWQTQSYILSLTKNFNSSLFFHSVGCIRAFSHTKSGPFESNSIIIRK